MVEIKVDYTYAVRQLAFLKSLFPEIPLRSQIDEEEYEYLCLVACDMLKHQVETCPDSEKWYFENLVKNYQTWEDILFKNICKNAPEFEKFIRYIYFKNGNKHKKKDNIKNN